MGSTGIGPASAQEQSDELEETAQAAWVEVSIAGLAYSPTSLVVAAGSTVRWTNFDMDLHTVTSVGPGPLGGGLSPGATFDYVFVQPGVYRYYCEPHPWMTGSVVITPSE